MEAGKTAHALHELSALGTPENVAQKLREKGIRGRLLDPFACPIARYLNQVTGNRHSMCVSYLNAWDPEEGRENQEHFGLPSTHPVRLFVNQFDAGQHEDLREG